jgi:hypothetical protein
VNKFNLTFRGEVLPGNDPGEARAGFAKLFDIQDAQRLEQFFSGEAIILRRNLERKAAAEYYLQLNQLGLEAELVKIEPDANGETAEPAGMHSAQWQAAQKKSQLAEEKRLLERRQTRRPGKVDGEDKKQRKRAALAQLQRAAKERRQATAEQAEQDAKAETARAKAQAELERQQRAEEAARRHAAAEAEKQRKAEEAARKHAAAEAEKQRKAEEAARKRAAAAAEKQRKAEDAARKRAAAEAEKQRKAEDAARKLAAAEAEKQRKAEEAAHKRAAAEAEKQRKAEEDRQRAAKAAARKDAETLAAQQRSAESAARKRAEAKTRSAAVPTEQSAALEEKAMQAGASALAGQPRLKRTQARVKSRLELPRRTDTSKPHRPRNPPGSPNTYRLQAFRSTREIQQRAETAAQQSRKGIVLGSVTLALLLILLGRFLSLSPATSVQGPSIVAANATGALVILAGDTLLLHDRAGVTADSLEASALGLEELSGPMVFDLQGDLLLAARAVGQETGPRTLWRCNLQDRVCQPAIAEAPGEPPAALTLNRITGEYFIASDNQLSKLGQDGSLRAKISLPLPTDPVLRLDSGLLFVNSAQGPAISVFRYEDQAFGQQLDEVLLLPPPALEREQTRVGSFTRSGDYWWVNLHNPETETSGLYLFDQNWKFIRALPRGAVAGRGRLTNWNSKVLLYSDQQQKILRFNEQGQAEVPLESESLALLIANASGKRTWVNAAWQVSLLLLFLASAGGFTWAYLQATRALVYRGRPAHGAAPLDDVAGDIHWLQTAPHRTRQWRQHNIAWGVVSVACLILLIGSGVSLLQLVAASLALAGPAIALQLMLRSEPEHAGTLAGQLVLADHREMYHMAAGPRVHYRGPFILIDDVIIFTGNRWFPGLLQAQVSKTLEPIVKAGIRVDRKTIAVKLLQSQHPVARSAIVIILGAILGALLLTISFLPWQG